MFDSIGERTPPHGCIMSRPCFCKLAERVAHQLCPVQFFWPLVTKRVRSGMRIFSSYYDTKANQTLKSGITKLQVVSAARYRSHGFRRGASNALKTRGPQWPAVLCLGEWRSLAFPGYVNLTPELGRDMAKLLIETDDFESDLGAVSDIGRWLLPFS